MISYLFFSMDVRSNFRLGCLGSSVTQQHMDRAARVDLVYERQHLDICWYDSGSRVVVGIHQISVSCEESVRGTDVVGFDVPGRLRVRLRRSPCWITDEWGGWGFRGTLTRYSTERRRGGLFGGGSGSGSGFLANPSMLVGIVAAAVTVPIAISSDDEDAN